MNRILSSVFFVILMSANALYAQSVSVGIGESGTQIEAGAVNSSKDSLDAEVDELWGVSNTSNKDGLLYFSYSDLAGTNLPSTIQPGTYTFSARIGASNVGDGFSGLNDITSGTNTEQGSVAGFFSSLSDDAETTKNYMVSEFNDQSGVTYYQPNESDPDALSFTTWTFYWTIDEDSPVVGTTPYFGVYTKTGSNGGNGFWDDSILTYSETVETLPTIYDFSSDLYALQTTGTLVTLSWEVSTNATSLSISPSIGDVLPLTVEGIGQTSLVVNAETTFTLTTSNEVQSFSSTLTIEAPSPVISGFSADDYYVSTNAPVVLSWAASSAETFVISEIGSVSATNSMTVYPSETTTYTLTAANVFSSVETNVTVAVGPERPNILIVLVDDFGPMDTSVPFAYDSYTDNGAELSTAFNTFYHTPNMEKLAANGMKFTQAYAMPMCSPTRVSLMTGQNTPRHGVTHHLNVYETIDNASFSITTHRGPNQWRYMGMDGTDTTLPQLLNDAGYRTVFLGKDHLSHQQEPTAIGFDDCDADLYKAVSMTPKAESMLEEAMEWGQPIFAYISYRDVHTSFYYASDYTNDYSAAYSTNHEKFATMVESVDNSLGSILDKLTELGIAEDTLIIFLGDNGSDSPALSDEGEANGDSFDDYPMRGKKGSTYEGGIRVPLIVAWASPNADNELQQSLAIPAASVEHDMVTVEDIAPTILAEAGVDTPETMDGYDLTPYLQEESGTHRPQKVLRHMPHEHRSNYFTCFREENWKIIYRYHIEESISGGETHEDSDYTSFELYNLASDPYETNNLASVETETLLTMARAMASELNDSWGDYGELWPTLNPEGIKIPDRPLDDDPFFIDFTVDDRASVDSDGDGLMDEEEDVDADGLVDDTETDADDSDTDGDGSDDYTELRLNLDPLDTDEAFVVTMSEEDDSSLLVTWPSATGTTYNILTTTNLVDTAWQIAVSNIQASAVSDETSQVVDDADQNSSFIRVELLP